tara:strand:+ start:301 stop:426 length:126 start_codon:yes stop_codon:yes gene_type:complete
MSRILRHPAILYTAQLIGFCLFLATFTSPIFLVALLVERAP